MSCFVVLVTYILFVLPHSGVFAEIKIDFSVCVPMTRTRVTAVLRRAFDVCPVHPPFNIFRRSPPRRHRTALKRALHSLASRRLVDPPSFISTV